jgi:predicted enzyme related to lactoylglutathione lyase
MRSGGRGLAPGLKLLSQACTGGFRSSRRGVASTSAGHTPSMPAPLIEFPADDPDRARRFWHGVLGVTLAPRAVATGSGWQTDTDGLRLGIHERGPGPGDTASLPYFTVADLATALERVRELGGSIIHPGDRWACARTPRAARSRWPRGLHPGSRTGTIASRANEQCPPISG